MVCDWFACRPDEGDEMEDEGEKKDKEKADEGKKDLLECCRDVCQEVLDMRVGMSRCYCGCDLHCAEYKPKDPEQKKRFRDWLQVYDKDDSNTVVDSGGRRIWFVGPPGGKIDSKKVNHIPPQSINLTQYRRS